jgi:predicted lipoprotein with Yx(FWY)xxD motif
MKLRRAPLLAVAAMALVALGLAACGGSSNSDNNASAATNAAATSSGQTVSTMSVSGINNALVDSSGKVLYTNDMDTGSKIACTGQCLTEWVPLAAPSGGQPTSSDSAVQAKLGMVKRPDGSTQVTWGGMPLYTFVEDTSGQATGNGFRDSFGGTNFLWTAATASGKAAASSGSTTGTSTSSGGSSSGGYSSGGGGGGGGGYGGY